MYGDKFGKSLCHAWAASPIYLLAPYFVGLRRDRFSFVLTPRLEFFPALDCTLPVDGKGSFVQLRWDGAALTMETNRAGGTLRVEGERYELSPGKPFELAATS